MRSVPTAALLLLAASFPVAAQGRLGADFTPGLVPIVEGIYVYEGPLHLQGEEEIVRTNSLVVLTDDGVVIVDGQDDPAEGRRLIAAVRSVTIQPIRYLINASPHGDHVNSNEVFVGATIVAHAGAYEAMREAGVRAIESGTGIVPPLPSVIYRESLTLRVGGRTLELYHFGLGHTRGDTVVLLPEERVAFLSELYFNGVFASVGEGYVHEHVETLERAMELPADWWLPGHGFVRGQSRAALAAGVGRYRDNLRAIESAVALRVARGETLEQVLAGVDRDLGVFADLPFYRYLKASAIGGTYRALTQGP